MRRFIALRVVTALVCWLMLVAIVYAQTAVVAAPAVPTTTKTVIGPDTVLFSWAAIVLLGAIIVSAITAAVSSRNHIADSSIHHQGEKLAEKYASRTECAAKHIDVKNDFNRVHERLDTIASSLARIEGKLDK